LSKPFNKVVLGGTFDGIHDGHKKLFEMAAKVSDTIHIGLTTKKLLNHKENAHLIKRYIIRELELNMYFIINHPNVKIKISPIDNIDGNLRDEETRDVEAIIISDEKKVFDNVSLINTWRSWRDLPRLVIIIVPLVEGKDGVRLSSSKIRRKLKNGKIRPAY